MCHRSKHYKSPRPVENQGMRNTTLLFSSEKGVISRVNINHLIWASEDVSRQPVWTSFSWKKREASLPIGLASTFMMKVCPHYAVFYYSQCLKNRFFFFAQISAKNWLLMVVETILAIDNRSREKLLIYRWNSGFWVKFWRKFDHGGGVDGQRVV